MKSRKEIDAYGEIEISASAYWGPQTERARRLFAIGSERLPVDVIHSFGAQKAAAAQANLSLGLLPERLATVIIRAALEMRDGAFNDQFPIGVWQTGSGTQTNMNANEVIANRANELLGEPLGNRSPIHPNDHVNLGQSSNDTFPTIMHVCAIRAVFGVLAPAMAVLQSALAEQAVEFRDHVKLGMTHLQDALPVTLGSEFYTWEKQVASSWVALEFHTVSLCELPQGGTASGSGINSHSDFAGLVADGLGAFVGRPLRASPTPSQFMASHDAFVGLCGALNVLATALLKICNDIRLLTSSLGGSPSMSLPDEGLSSSIMPAKRNATVCEAVIQVCLRVIGNSAAVIAANSASTLQLNTTKPLILNEVLNSVYLLADAQRVLASGCIKGLQANRDRLRLALDRSPVLGAVLAPVIGYDAAAHLTREASTKELSMRDVIVREGAMSVADYDAYLAQALDPNRLSKHNSTAVPSPLRPVAANNSK
ncbi:class II fumarate hydratase [Metarhizobium album]|uniref:fumarate hydratase n=1 Tax=Metarhizobium album TaxID=2182425 RepID=A0A2U2DJD8_9HYPH|nr:class II fumarate hydratase [Rhizobium album]PWE53361.1 class II fumarate hydratase [Rhizobium album]